MTDTHTVTNTTPERDPARGGETGRDHRSPPSDAPLWRDLAIALNATDGLWRPAVCRLAEDAARWAEPSAVPTAELACSLGAPETQLRRAFEVLPRAAEIAAREIALARELDADVVTRFDPDYPQALLDLALPPPVLYRCGPLAATVGTPGSPSVAIVGSRKPDADGREAAELFARVLADAGVTVVSGFARGIDAAAHRGAVASGCGPTIAVLGCGLGVSYPRDHRALRRQIEERGGALVTEWRCGTLPRPWRFPVRNRVIAALARITLVVQAAPRSGSLITARHALELGREVWAVPGRIFDETSLGTNALIRDGAYPALHPRDVLEALRVLPTARGSEPPAAPQPSKPEAELPAGLPGRILQALPAGPSRPAETLAVELGVPVDRVLAELLELELVGRVRRVPGPEYRRVQL